MEFTAFQIYMCNNDCFGAFILQCGPPHGFLILHDSAKISYNLILFDICLVYFFTFNFSRMTLTYKFLLFQCWAQMLSIVRKQWQIWWLPYCNSVDLKQPSFWLVNFEMVRALLFLLSMQIIDLNTSFCGRCCPWILSRSCNEEFHSWACGSDTVASRLL